VGAPYLNSACVQLNVAAPVRARTIGFNRKTRSARSMVTAQWAMPYVILPSREMYQNLRSRNPQGCGKLNPNLNNRVLHDQLPVAAGVRARKTRFKPIGWASASGSGAQWTARPTNALRLWAEIGARPSWPQVFCDRDGRAPVQIGARPSWPQLTPLTRTGLRSFWGVEVAEQWER